MFALLSRGLFKKLRSTFKTKKLLAQISSGKIPSHVAIIMDGNGRWAKKRGLPRIYGHNAGIDTMRNVVKWSNEVGLKVLTFYAFSTENWRRPASEVNFLMQMPSKFLETELEKLVKNNIKLQIFGELTRLPRDTRGAIQKAVDKTRNGSGLILNLAFNYGSRTEIIRAVKIIAEKVRVGTISPEEINEKIFSGFLYTKGLPDPDLLIRPSGEFRLSNFLLWQLAYAEFWFAETMWPDFSKEEFLNALLEYQKRERRFGGIEL